MPLSRIVSASPVVGNPMFTGAQTIPAAEKIAGNEDLLIQILFHLPIRSLFRFKSVSKQWHNLISDRRFCHLHSRLHRNPSCSGLLFFNQYPSCFAFDFVPLRANGNSSTPPPFFFDLESNALTILQSCNGLLLLRSLNSDFAYFVCNPTTNQISRLPVHDEIANGNLSVISINLAFDPKKSDGYKIVCVWGSNSDLRRLGIDLYLSEISQWRRSIDRFPETLVTDLDFYQGVYCDGKIYWLSETEVSFFDLESERIRLLPLPLPLPPGPPMLDGVPIPRFCYLGESMGHLHLIEIRTTSVIEFNVLELENETLIWFIKYRVNLDPVWDHVNEMLQGRVYSSYSGSIVAVIRAERDEDSILVLSIPGKVISYNFETGFTEFTDLLCELEDRPEGEPDIFSNVYFGLYNTYQFFETLYCI